MITYFVYLLDNFFACLLDSFILLYHAKPFLSLFFSSPSPLPLPLLSLYLSFSSPSPSPEISCLSFHILFHASSIILSFPFLSSHQLQFIYSIPSFCISYLFFSSQLIPSPSLIFPSALYLFIFFLISPLPFPSLLFSSLLVSTYQSYPPLYITGERKKSLDGLDVRCFFMYEDRDDLYHTIDSRCEDMLANGKYSTAHVLCCAVLCFAVLCCAVLCSTLLFFLALSHSLC